MSRVYALNIADLDESYLCLLKSKVSDQRRNEVETLSNGEKVKQQLVSESLIRTIVRKELGMSEIGFGKGPYGKPFIIGLPDFYYNLAHSGAWVVCAIDCAPIGIDIERVRPVDADLARLYFSTDEYRSLIVKDEPERSSLFFDLWTLKESYVKAKGGGLAIPLDSFTIYPEQDRIAVLSQNGPEEVFFKWYELGLSYRVSVCAGNGDFPDNITRVGLDDILNPARESFECLF
ncbi:MAG: 4'-phosphopantetheinyl transferase superfamily protein [Thermacetogeniaceae bacterium]